MSRVVKVAAAVIRGEAGQILIAKRPEHVHMGGYWEFPGGKVEDNEAVSTALARELEEELGIAVQYAQPLIQVLHHYPDKSVFLDVWEVSSFSGQASGREGQEIRWVSAGALADYRFPDANLPIVKAANLPDTCFVTGDARDLDDFLTCLANARVSGAGLVILRPWQSGAASELKTLLAGLKSMPNFQSTRWYWHLDFFAGDLSMASEFVRQGDQFGLHLPAAALCAANNVAVPFCASCHSAEELQKAAALGADFGLLSPVKPTKNYSDSALLGWGGFARQVRDAKLPVYGLGGLTRSDVERARVNGGQGVAMVRAWWTSGG